MKTIIIALRSVQVVLEETELTFNPDGLLKCLEEASPVAADVRELIRLIKAKQYEAAVTRAIEVFNNGSQLIKRCGGYIFASVNLTVNWVSLGKCIAYAAGGAGLAAQLGTAILAKDVVKLASNHCSYWRSSKSLQKILVK